LTLGPGSFREECLARLDEEFFGAGKECQGCEQEFFPEGHVKSNFLCNLGYGDPSKLFARAPRLEFNEASTLLVSTSAVTTQSSKTKQERRRRRTDMGKLEGKIALVTGGNSGIGLATAKQFVNEGAYVFITGRRDAELAAAVKEIGRNITGIQGDVSNLSDLDRLFAQIKREKGELDIVFANAGIAKYSAFGEITEDLYDSIFDINVKGVLFTVQKALPLLPDGASIILNSSIVGSKGLSSNSVYSATKAAVRSFARTWTTDLKDRRIRVNAVSPGSIDTPGLNEILASSDVGEQR
jgi:NAD(P)-dependent dehydrogenase (short-subunit alcohol dehydrogenase family)